MKKIVVAGCGHGGLSAAANLSLNGYDVTVLESKKREDLGYDWHDSVRKKTFENSGLPSPDESCYLPPDRMCYYNPKKTVKIFPNKEASKTYAYLDRKFLINHLIDYAEKCGVKFKYECKIISAVCSADRVDGIKYIENSEEKLFYADLVIDACGLFSPVKLSLPERFLVENKIEDNNVFYAWRGYFEKTEDIITEPESSIYFYHCNHRGMDWAITKPGYMDILVGGFGSLDEQDINNAIKDFLKVYPYMTDKIIRGGYSDKIPLGKTLPVFVCNGYAAVGNSAGMTEPLSGSGLDLSLNAGKILSDTVVEAKGDCSVASLWKYNYRYFKLHGERRYNSAIIKNMLSILTADDIDFLMEKNIMGEKEIANTGGSYTVKEIIQKLNVFRKPSLLVPLSSMLAKMAYVSKLKKSIPQSYTESDVKKWISAYKKL